jgi:hypothetical protein
VEVLELYVEAGVMEYFLHLNPQLLSGAANKEYVRQSSRIFLNFVPHE